ncbi:YpfB family protein [Bacillus sp. DX1.1]|uniref:YpfB family protein n=1 Tax=unclassified Bacillus (in: firmicutes) TaxID=185979 RepID=UPI002570E72A|nr:MULTISPECIES: YpfB family protein [unclassified Bacillus (in: firmicutes)]MDM5154120.1 YpfB family protein [Bacillus sp. DX1.1]MDM5187786.1 YpfB family protein [Bacillus sp. DX4.1]WJE83045.1 YpfB family protein [Bacillus sp. DX3.1]
MKNVEKILIRILLIQSICLCIVQLLFMQESTAKYLSKIVYYEGVIKENVTNILQVNK